MRLLNVILIAVVTVASSGCASDRPVLTRGWIGGDYEDFRARGYFDHVREMANETESSPLANADLERRKSGVIVAAVHPGTPAAAGGLAAGDLILTAATTPIHDTDDLHEVIDAIEPGESVELLVLREDEPTTVRLTAGEERYQNWGFFSLGFGLSLEFDPIPDPDFDLFSLVVFTHRDNRIDLYSPTYRTVTRRFDPQQDTPDFGVESDEGWLAWIGIMGWGRKVRILGQAPTRQ